MVKTLMIGSCEPFSGKSALVLGIARQIIASGKSVRFGKPLATSVEIDNSSKKYIEEIIDDDVRFVGDTLGLSEDHLIPSIHLLAGNTANDRLIEGVLEAGEGLDKLKTQLSMPFEGINVFPL